MRENRLAQDLDFILTQTASVWPELKDQSIFITGGTGFIGTWLLESFAWANTQHQLNLSLTVLTRDLEAFKRKAPHLAQNPAIRFITGDVRDFIFPQGYFSHIIHGATDASATLNDNYPALMLETIVQGTRHTLAFAQQVQAKRFLLLSSGAVYGKQPPEISHITEDYRCPSNALISHSVYAVGKDMAEKLCLEHAAQHTMEMTIARCFAFMGPYLPLDKHFAAGNFIRDAMQGKAIQIKSDGTAYRSYQYASELIIWLLRILCHGKSGVAYNVGSDEIVSISELAKAIAAHFIPVLPIQIAEAPLQNKLPERYVPCVQRAQKDLGLKNTIGLEEAIQKTICWHNKGFHHDKSK